MPKRVQRPCRNKACNTLHRNANGYCDAHAQDATGWARTEQRKGNRHQRGYGSAWTKLRAQILRRDRYLCQPCLQKGRPTEATEVDHIKPKSQGGTDHEHNLRAICKACHKAKTQREQGRGGSNL